MASGVVKWFNDKKGFGFIQHDDKDYFVYFKDIKNNGGFKTLKEGERVTFSPSSSPKGWVATNVYHEDF